ncbi:MAG: hypothetical protein ACRD0M_11910, partial [Acidimicrobiales bacterium]
MSSDLGPRPPAGGDPGDDDEDGGAEAPEPAPVDPYEVFGPLEGKKPFRRLPALVALSLRLVWAAGRRELLVTSAVQLVVAVAGAVQLLVGKVLLDAVFGAGEAGGRFSAVIGPLGALVAVGMVVGVASAIQVEQNRVLSDLVSHAALDRILDVAGAVDLAAFESPGFFDRLERARMAGQFRPRQMVDGVVGLVGSTLGLAGLTLALLTLQPLVALFALASFAPLWWANTRNSRLIFYSMHGITPIDRQLNYLRHVLTNRNEAKEVKAFGLGPLLRRRYDRLWGERLVEVRAVARQNARRSMAASAVTSSLTGLSMGVLAWLYVEGRMALAAVGVAAVGLLQLRGRVGGLARGTTSLY